MRITSRRKTIVFFITLGACLVGIAVNLSVGWIILNWREVVPLVLGVVLFSMIIAGLILNTIFLVREVRRNEQHDSFINAVTHELKTPIASMRLYLQTLLARDLVESQKREFYQVMLADTDRLMATVDQVLKAGQVSNRTRSKFRVKVDFRRLVQECVEVARVRHNLEPQSLSYSEELHGDRGTVVLGDPEELRTAVSNVLDNAVKYSGDAIHITVRITSVDESRLALRVQDSGVGISDAELKRIFKRFYRVPDRETAHVKGTGLGLFIVRSIVSNHGGKVVAASDGAGRGTTVTIEIPTTTGASEIPGGFHS